MMSTAALFCGAASGCGLFLIVRELLPARPDLGAVLDRLENTQAPEPVMAEQGAGFRARSDSWAEQIGARVLERSGASLTLPRRELDLLGIPLAKHLGDKVIGAVAGFVLPQLGAALAALGGTALPLPLPLFVSVLFGLYLWVSADSNVRAKAKVARLEFRYAVASFMERARLERGAKSGADAAVYNTASVGDGWVLARIRATLEHAKLAGIPPWQALKTLAEQLDVPELASPAETFSLAGGEGTSIRATLATQSRSLRDRLLTDKQAEANSASEKSVVPGTIIFAVLFAVIGYPAFTALMAT
ncbi:hypothetical protein P8605_14170 [Streptomyces sp. T-3]|nr:hypothetical protein [Streptomyces sp. T-3]